MAVAANYDVFVSYAHVDSARVRPIVAALRGSGLSVWFDERAIEDFESISASIQVGLARSKVMLAFYSAAYPTRRPCQWELTAGFVSAQRLGDPRERVLVVNPEPTPEHVQPIELREAKHRPAPAPADEHGLTDLAASVQRRVSSVSGVLGDGNVLGDVRWLPDQRLGSPRFVGRTSDMWAIHTALHSGSYELMTGVAGSRVAQVRGLGGVGKSLLAQEYALRFRGAYSGGVFWLRALGDAELTRAERAAARDRQLDEIASRLDPQPEASTAGSRATIASAIAAASAPCLWIVDDLPTGLRPDVDFESWLAPHPLGHTLFTTRSGEYDQVAAVDLDVLPAGDAYALLTARRPPSTDDERDAARELAKALGYYPLALEVQAAAVAASHGLRSYADHLRATGEHTVEELELAGELAGSLPTGHERSISATLLRGIGSLGSEGRDVIRVAAVLAPDPIPLPFAGSILAAASNIDVSAADQKLVLGLRQLELSSLISSRQEDAFGIHTLVARSALHGEDDPARLAAIRDAAVLTCAAALADVEHVAAEPGLVRELPHALELCRHLERPPQPTSRARLRWRLRRTGTTSAPNLPERVDRYLTERLAVTLHRQWLADERRRRERGQGNEQALALTAWFQEWPDVPDSLKDQTRKSADHARLAIRLLGAELVPVAKPPADVAELALSAQEVELIARQEHQHWVSDKLREGWRYGAVRDDSNKLHDMLVPWDALTERARDMDRALAATMPKLFAHAGFELRRRN